VELRDRHKRGTFQWQPRQYGISVQGAPLQVWMPANSEVKILIYGGIHGDETETTITLSRALRSLAQGSPHCAIVLAANPDGMARGTRCNANGVDLNRNCPTSNWSAEPVPYRWSENSPRDVNLSAGSSPGSEPETQALLKLIEEVKPEYIVSLHGAIECIDDPNSTGLGQWLSEKTEMPLVPDVGYDTPGSFGTWANEHNYRLITYEFPSASDEEHLEKQFPVLIELLSDKELASL